MVSMALFMVEIYIQEKLALGVGNSFVVDFGGGGGLVFLGDLDAGEGGGLVFFGFTCFAESDGRGTPIPFCSSMETTLVAMASSSNVAVGILLSLTERGRAGSGSPEVLTSGTVSSLWILVPRSISSFTSTGLVSWTGSSITTALVLRGLRTTFGFSGACMDSSSFIISFPSASISAFSNLAFSMFAIRFSLPFRNANR